MPMTGSIDHVGPATTALVGGREGAERKLYLMAGWWRWTVFWRVLNRDFLARGGRLQNLTLWTSRNSVPRRGASR